MNLTIEEMSDLAASFGEKPFRGKQLFKWVHSGREFNEMNNLPSSFINKLKENAEVCSLRVELAQRDNKDGTCKMLFRLKDGNAVEGVFMKYKYGNSLCVSSQVGCRMGCRFCASALGGFVRNLTAGEMAGQIYRAERECGDKINHIVVMGMGEPFDNYEELSRFLRIIHHEAGRNMSYRNITVSTSGIIPMMERFASDFPQVNLAISLHRLTDSGRSEIMPINRKYPLDQLLAAAAAHAEKTGRRITFEYTLIKGENDSDEDLELIVRRLKGMLCHVNLIPLNKVEETGYVSAGRKQAEIFARKLEAEGISATVRRELGGEIDGACGQLRLKKSKLSFGISG